MPVLPPVRSAAPRRALLALAALTVGACAEGAQSAAASDGDVQPVAATPAPAARPHSTADSLEAARRATVLDTAPLPPLAPPRAPAAVATSDSAARRAADSTSARDTTRRRARRGPLGSAGDQHPAYRDAGSDLDSLWPVRTPPPLPGAILPAKRIIAFYGNPLSTRMGILGEFAARGDAAASSTRRSPRGTASIPRTPCSRRCT